MGVLGIVVISLCILSFVAAQQYYLASDGRYYLYSGQQQVAPEATTKAPQNRFNQAGWETDDTGNVYVGNDNAKLYLISVGSYWPFGKDYRKKREAAPGIWEILGIL